jgi:PEP-CTERM motif
MPLEPTHLRACARRSRVWLVVVLGALLVIPSAGFGAPLYLNDVQGALRLVDPSTGASTLVGEFGTAVPGARSSYTGLAARPDGSSLYTLRESRFTGAPDVTFETSLIAIDPATGSGTAFPRFDVAALGMILPDGLTERSGVGYLGIAISPSHPDVAVVLGTDVYLDFLTTIPYLWTVDLDTGLPLGSAIRLPQHVRALAYGPDGTTLYGAVSAYHEPGTIVTVDPILGTLKTVGSAGPLVSEFITGLAFDPADGTLYASDGYENDRLVTLDPVTGAAIEVIGPLGIPGPEGIAFLPVPEPSTALLLGLGLAGLVRRRAALLRPVGLRPVALAAEALGESVERPAVARVLLQIHAVDRLGLPGAVGLEQDRP